MSALFRGSSDHERARELAAWRMDGLLEPVEEAWLDEHLAGCDACAAAVADYTTDRLLLQGLREHAPEPPRDLWARTAAAIESTGSARPVVVAQASRDGSGRLGWVLAPVAGVAIIAVAVGAGLLNSQPVVAPGPLTALATPMTVAADIQVLGQGEDGQLEIRTQNVREVCPVGAESCSVAPSAATEALAGPAPAPVVKEAILSPARDRLVIVQGDEDGQGVYVVPVTTAGEGPAASPVALATPVPAATVSPAATAVAPSPGGSADPAATAPAGSPAATEAPVSTADATPGPDETSDPAASPTLDPGSGGGPVASTGPEPTAEPATATPAPAEPSPSVDVTPGPDGAIQIASDVVVVGPAAAYNRAGTRFAFTAYPADRSAGPDVYVWNTSESRARRVTSDHRSFFAGWHARDLVVSRIGDRDASTWLVDPVDGTATGPVSDGWLPTISPDGKAAAWWDGKVRFGRDGVTPVTGAGSLVLGPWEREGRMQQLAEGPLRSWSVRWDPSGSVLAVWKGGKTDEKPGTLSLYRVAEDGRTVDLEHPIREDEPAFEGFVLDTDHLAWPATNSEGKPVVRVLAWNDEGVGVVELPSEGGGTIVH